MLTSKQWIFRHISFRCGFLIRYKIWNTDIMLSPDQRRELFARPVLSLPTAREDNVFRSVCHPVQISFPVRTDHSSIDVLGEDTSNNKLTNWQIKFLSFSYSFHPKSWQIKGWRTPYEKSDLPLLDVLYHDRHIINTESLLKFLLLSFWNDFVVMSHDLSLLVKEYLFLETKLPDRSIRCDDLGKTVTDSVLC